MVDSFKFLPRSIAATYRETEVARQLPIPWTPLARPLADCRVGLVTTAGLYLPATQPPFDVERERREPTWGDPTYRAIPRDTPQAAFGAAHLHINTDDLLADVNVALPLDRLRELEAAGVIGSLAPTAYSFMGFQGWPPDQRPWQEQAGPEVAARLRAEAVDAVLLTPT